MTDCFIEKIKLDNTIQPIICILQMEIRWRQLL